jgi:hypothetical protein
MKSPSARAGVASSGGGKRSEADGGVIVCVKGGVVDTRIIA